MLVIHIHSNQVIVFEILINETLPIYKLFIIAYRLWMNVNKNAMTIQNVLYLLILVKINVVLSLNRIETITQLILEPVIHAF